MRRVWISIAASLSAVAVAAPTAAGAVSLYDRVLHAYQASGGTIPPCEFTASQLESAKNGSDTYANQYFADFGNAIENALAARAAGACVPTAGSATATLAHPHRGPPLPLPPVSAATGASVPTPILLLGVLGGLLLAAAGVATVARARGWDPAWAAAWRHAFSEAEYRIAGTWANLRERSRRRASGGPGQPDPFEALSRRPSG